jgi:uncharacterized protein
MDEAMGVSLKTEQRRSHSAVASFRQRVRRAEGYRGTRHPEPCRQVPVKPRRPPSPRLICEVFPDHSSFSVFRETPMACTSGYFKKLSSHLNQRRVPMAISKELLDILACPKCKGDITLNEAGNGLICDKCKLLYEIKDDIPIMLIDEAKPLP